MIPLPFAIFQTLIQYLRIGEHPEFCHYSRISPSSIPDLASHNLSPTTEHEFIKFLSILPISHIFYYTVYLR